MPTNDRLTTPISDFGALLENAIIRPSTLDDIKASETTVMMIHKRPSAVASKEDCGLLRWR
ncbi:hypothetical protein AC578_8739 [Pseudocercospora eumusae]|uniref:Uncharacterized protein n=1 Tax=Pseudocercospora eumusae TaxID=321146 RepID=A0A139HPZ8_9PEZI|nr:hypothetical protein AC578_8739 [Pseudocercospora eumusae]